MLNLQDLPDEVILKILSYQRAKELISCGQVSTRIRKISHDGTLWTTANLEKKIVKAEFLEMILGKGCRNLNLCHSRILGRFSSNLKSQLSVLKWFQTPFQPECECNIINCNCVDDKEDETQYVLEELLSSCCSLQHLVIEDVFITLKMMVSICENGKTLQTLKLNKSYFDFLENDSLDDNNTFASNYLQEIIKCCQELKEVDLAYVNGAEGLEEDDLELLVRNISPNVENLNLISSYIKDDHVKTLLRRCNKIKALSLEPLLITDDSLKNIRQHLNHTLEELSLGPNDGQAMNRHLGQDNYYDMIVILPSLFGLKSMQRLKLLNLCYIKDDSEEIQNLRQQLPHLMIKGVLN